MSNRREGEPANPSMQDTQSTLFPDASSGANATIRQPRAGETLHNSGILPSQGIKELIRTKRVSALAEIRNDQIQPASLDLRLGKTAYRVRASFLPGKRSSLKAQLKDLELHRINLSKGAVLERGCVYLVPLQENLNLPRNISVAANPKSSTGRLDVFVRLIAEHSEIFDYVEPGYHGALYAEISPRSFGICVREGSRLNQIRFRQLAYRDSKHRSFALTDKQLENVHLQSQLASEEPTIRDGLNIRVNLTGKSGKAIVGYKANRHASIIDVDRIAGYSAKDFWEPLKAPRGGRLVLDPLEFYILASKEYLHIPPHLAAEMVPIDPAMGEFRVHYAGFFDPGFGHCGPGSKGSKGVLEVRSHEVPFFLEDGQVVTRLVYERLTEVPDILYGSDLKSHYQAQGLKLSKHFK